MSGSKQKRQIGKLVQMLIRRYDVSTVYVEDIADCLECSRDVVKNELGLLYEQGILEPVFELRCCLCGGIIATHESPRYLTGGMAAECPHCLNQSQYESEADLVSAWAVRKETDDEAFIPYAVDKRAVISDGSYSREA
jgi:hypothetical protein